MSIREKKKNEVTESIVATIETVYISSKLVPSIRQLATEYNYPKSTIAKIIADKNLVQRRKEWQDKVLTKVQNSYLMKQEKRTREIAKGVDNVVSIGLKNLTDSIRMREYEMTVGELDKMIRLRQLLIGKPDSRSERIFKLDKPIDDYTLEELEEIKNNFDAGAIDAEYEVIDEEDEE